MLNFSIAFMRVEERENLMKSRFGFCDISHNFLLFLHCMWINEWGMLVEKSPHNWGEWEIIIMRCFCSNFFLQTFIKFLVIMSILLLHLQLIKRFTKIPSSIFHFLFNILLYNVTILVIIKINLPVIKCIVES